MRACEKACHDIPQYERLLETLEDERHHARHDEDEGEVGNQGRKVVHKSDLASSHSFADFHYHH